MIVAIPREQGFELLWHVGEVTEPDGQHDEAAAEALAAFGDRHQVPTLRLQRSHSHIEALYGSFMPEPVRVAEVEIAGQRLDVPARPAQLLEVRINRMDLQRVQRPVAARAQVHSPGHVVLPEAHGRADDPVPDIRFLCIRCQGQAEGPGTDDEEIGRGVFRRGRYQQTGAEREPRSEHSAS